MVEDDEVAGLEVEAVELVAGGFGVEDVFVDDEGGALSVRGDALADLSARVLVWAGRVMVGLGNGGLPNGPELAEEVEEFLGRDVVAEVLDE